MADRPLSWPGAAPPPQGWLPPPQHVRPFPVAPAPPRPVYREPHPIRTAPLLAGLGAATVWFALFGSIGRDLASYAWWSIGAAVSAWLVALVLSVAGDRGVATGIALSSGFGLSVAMGFVAHRWITTADWPLW